MSIDEFDELAEFEPQTQRLVIQMQELMKKIWNGNRGVHRHKKIQEFNVRIANIIEFTSGKVKVELDEAHRQIETLNVCLDSQFHKKWKLMAKCDKLQLEVANKLGKSQTSHDCATQTDSNLLDVKIPPW
tara:strand:+ start:53 stop:442 length:390 start_codon:yes stop_codon:yes gene_type:complete